MQAGVSIAYVPDHAPAAGVSDEAMAAMDGVDILIEDAQFLAHERPRAVDYGHATIDEAIALAEKVNARSLVLFHHGPHRTDDALDQIARSSARRIRERRPRGHGPRPALIRPHAAPFPCRRPPVRGD